MTVVPNRPFPSDPFRGSLDGMTNHGTTIATQVLAPVYVAVPTWGGLYLRNSRVRDFAGAR